MADTHDSEMRFRVATNDGKLCENHTEDISGLKQFSASVRGGWIFFAALATAVSAIGAFLGIIYLVLNGK